MQSRARCVFTAYANTYLHVLCCVDSVADQIYSCVLVVLLSVLPNAASDELVLLGLQKLTATHLVNPKPTLPVCSRTVSVKITYIYFSVLTVS